MQQDTTDRDATDIVGRLVADPEYSQRVGTGFARAVRDLDFDAILIWDDPESAVLAHIVGLERGVRVLRAFEVEGLVEAIDPPPRGVRGLILAPEFDREGAWRALATLAGQADGTVVAIAALRSNDVLETARAAGHRIVLVGVPPPGDAAPSGDAGAPE